MPNRILRDWTDSEPVNSLSWPAECLFIRLIMKADDYGCFHGNPKLLKSLLFPLKDGLRDSDITRWLKELSASGMIRTYTADGGKPFVEIRNYGQRPRDSRRKFPAPPPESEEIRRDSPQLAATRRNSPPYTETESIEKEIYKEKPNKTAAELADRLWNLYPLKTGIVPAKLAAKRAYEAELTKSDRKFIWTMKTFFDAGHQFDDPETWQRKGEKENVSTKDIPANSDFEGFVNNEDF